MLYIASVGVFFNTSAFYGKLLLASNCVKFCWFFSTASTLLAVFSKSEL